jgi:hypothetical protein
MSLSSNTETKQPIKREEEEEEDEDDFAPTTSQLVESAVTRVIRVVTRTSPLHIHKGDLPNLDHWEYPRSDFECLFVSFQHAQSVLFEAGTYQEREESLFPETAPWVERKAPPCARGSKCVATRQPFPLVEEPRHRGPFVLMAMPRPDEKADDGQGRLCFLCHLEALSLVAVAYHTQLVPHVTAHDTTCQQFYCCDGAGEFRADCLLKPQTPFNGLLAPVPMLRYELMVVRYDPETKRRYVDISAMRASASIPSALHSYPSEFQGASKN